MPPETESVSSEPPSNASPSSRLPDCDVLGSLTDVKPGTIPLLLRMPDGRNEQLDVPLHSTVDDITSHLQKDTNDIYRLSFRNSELDPSASLLDTNIVDAYEHAGSLLHLIASGRQDVDTKAAALDSACAVVETISNGIKDMEALCAAAMPETADQPDQPHSPGPNPEQSSDPERPELKSSSGPSPSQLANSLTRRLPNLFPPNDNTAASSQEDTEQPTLGRRVTAQPSLSSIAVVRRRKALSKAREKKEDAKRPERIPDIAIGESTNAPLHLDLEDPSEAQQHDRGSFLMNPNADKGSSLILANSDKGTWLEDVMKTWEVGIVRQSGVLEKSKDGQELNDYLHSLKNQAERELQMEKIDNEKQPALGQDSVLPGDSSDEEEANEEQQGDTHDNPNTQNATIPNGRPTLPNGRPSIKGDNATDEVQKSIAAVNISDRGRSNAATQMLIAQNAASAAVMEGTTGPDHLTKTESPVSQPSTNHRQQRPSLNSVQMRSQKQPPPPPQPHQGRPQQAQSVPNHTQQRLPQQPRLHIPPQGHNPAPVKTPISKSPSSSSTCRTDRSPSSSKGSKTKPLFRQATKIAPAPSPVNSPLAGANGLFSTQVYPVVPGATLAQNQQGTTGPKKRGRKRKNPYLSEEDRLLARKAQNRESAKLSRVRRKVIAAEYEGRLNALIDENTMLRKQVEGLNNRLVYLQSLLTISVRQEPSSS